LVVLGYGAGFFQLDRAYARYLSSLREPQNAPAEIQIATSLDPGLKLYPLQAGYQRANAFLEARNAKLQSAVHEYREAVEMESSWDTGWMNLAALEIERGDPRTAVEYLEKAREINQRSPASYWWATLAESLKAAPDETIINAYVTAIESSGYLPLAAVWWETPLRREAVRRYLERAPADNQYRVLSAHLATDNAELREIVPAQPDTAEEWWIAGEQALTRQNDAQKAAAFFTEAIHRAPGNGDYYASRARAELAADPAAAERDLQIAELLGTYAEYPNAIRAQMTAAEDEAYRLRAEALPPRRVGQEFAGVLFGRIADFDLLPTMRLPGPGREAMQPWYELAQQYEAAGDRQAALNVYNAILDYAPDEQEAATQQQALEMQVTDSG
jgi:tetratricopeptide (TPR) repeat protein